MVDGYCSEAPGTLLQTENFQNYSRGKEESLFCFCSFFFFYKFYEFISVHLSQIDDMLERKILNAPRRFFCFSWFSMDQLHQDPFGNLTNM